MLVRFASLLLETRRRSANLVSEKVKKDEKLYVRNNKVVLAIKLPFSNSVQ